MHNDWRLTDQKKYLDKAVLKKCGFFAKKAQDHEHCAFCWLKFTANMKGYCTLDEKFWICNKCFEDFHDFFDWKENKNT